MKEGKLFVVAVVVVLLAVQASALALETDKKQYFKQESVLLNGECEPAEVLLLNLRMNEKKVFEAVFDCSQQGDFNAAYKISFLDPAGNWTAELRALNKIESQAFYVTPVPEGAYFVITFLSPSSDRGLKRTEDIKISVRITDARVVVTDANVITWGLDGEKHFMENRGDGIYSLDYEIPYNTSIKKWNMLVLAQRTDQAGGVFGGEGESPFDITNAPIVIDVVQPTVHSFDLLDSVPFSVKISYFNGKKVMNPTVTVALGDMSYGMELDGEGMFKYVYSPKGGDSGSRNFVVTARDDAGNEDSKGVSIVFTGSFIYFIVTNSPYILAAIIVVVVLSLKFYRQIKNIITLKALYREKRKMEKVLGKTQQEYFEKGLMPADIYKQNVAEYKTKISDLDKKIKGLEKNMALEKAEKPKKPGKGKV